jgi:cytoplasmic iron level regulating protein YaaA (DUF328/UPF0246 family)
MLFLLSSAKSLDFDPPAVSVPHSQTLFVPQARALMDILQQKSPQEIASLMSLSDSLAGLNVARYQAWSPKFTAKNAKQALLAFNGDVYDGLDVLLNVVVVTRKQGGNIDDHVDLDGTVLDSVCGLKLFHGSRSGAVRETNDGTDVDIAAS